MLSLAKTACEAVVPDWEWEVGVATGMMPRRLLGDDLVRCIWRDIAPSNWAFLGAPGISDGHLGPAWEAAPERPGNRGRWAMRAA